MSNYEITGLSADATIAEAQRLIRKFAHTGVICPCCASLVRIYNRKLNSGMARTAMAIYRLGAGRSDGWVHVNQEVVGNPALPRHLSDGAKSRDFYFLRFWGLIEERPKDEKNKSTRTSGCWRLTDNGCKFVEGKITVPRSIKHVDEVCLGFSEDLVSINEALGSKFNYSELMG